MAKVALLVGVSEYQPGLNSLPAAIKDVDALKQILQNPDIGGFAETDISVLKNPRRDDLGEAIEKLFSNRKKDDLVLFFFSGHGIKDDAGKLYLATHNTRKTEQGDLIRSSAVSASFIHETMSRSRSKRQVIILDSCFSGAFAEGLSAKDDGTVNIREELGGEGRAILTSSSSTQYSFEQQESDLSLYTKCLIEGISTGKADIDGDEVVSINDLHKYVSERIQEIQPAMKPEIYAIREGFDIRIAKVPPVEPSIKYRQAVEKYGKRGELTIVSRGILDSLRLSLELSSEEAEMIETEVLQPYRKAFQEKLQKYENIFRELLEKRQTISETNRQELDELQKVLELRNEDTIPIEVRVTANLEAYQENLQKYEQIYRETLRQNYPLTEAKRQELEKTAQKMELTEANVISIKTRVTAEIEAYYRNLEEYRQLFSRTVYQEYPLSKRKQNELKAEQNRLGLTEIDVASIKAEIINEIETYQQKLQQYEKAFLDVTKGRYYPIETTRQQLYQTWQELELSEIDITRIEAKIKKQIDKYQSDLRQYDQEFYDAIKEQYPLSEAKKQQLQQRKQVLALAEEDIKPIETRLKTEIEEYLQKLEQYKQVFTSLIDYEYPIRNNSRQELQDLQKVLELTDKERNSIETKIILERKGVVSPDKNLDNKIKTAPPDVDLEGRNREQQKTTVEKLVLRKDNVVIPPNKNLDVIDTQDQQVDDTNTIANQRSMIREKSPAALRSNSEPVPSNGFYLMSFPNKSRLIMGFLVSLGVLLGGVGLYSLIPQSPTPSPSSTLPPSSSPKEYTLNPPLEGNVALSGAGASFPAPLFQNWFVQLNKAIPQLAVNYQAVGSGAGVEQFITGTVDFGASDVAMTDEQIAKVDRGVLMLPTTAGAIVLAYNLPGVEGLKLSREAYVGIFKGEITNWNDPRIAAANPDIELPNQPIIFVYRSDGSGATGIFTKHLSAISSDWEATIGQGKSVKWPTNKGISIGAKGNEGVTASIQQNEGSIGYVEYGYAKFNDLPMAALENASGNFIKPSDQSGSATLDAVTLPSNLRAFITDPEGDASYPIVTYSWMLAYKDYDDPQKAIAMEAMIQYALTTGQEQSAALGYIPLPPSVREKVAEAADIISPDFEITVD